MADTAINLTIGSILSGIGYIGLSIEEYNLKNEKILDLQREIQLITPFIQNFQTCPPQAGIYVRLQKLAILLQQIKIWITDIGQMSKFKHFIFAISHTKQISKFYLDIKEIKLELGFEIRVGNFQSQIKLNEQMDDLLESIKHNTDYEKIKLLFDTQRDLCDAKLETHKEFIREMDCKYNLRIQEQEIEIEQLNKRMADVEQQLIDKQVEKITPLMVEHSKIQLEYQKVQLDIIRSKNYRYELELISKGKLVSEHTADIDYQKTQLELSQNQNKPTCTCEFSIDSCEYPYTATFCSEDCRGKKCEASAESIKHFEKKLIELCDSIPLSKREQYEEFIQYIERKDFWHVDHIIILLEYEMELRRRAEEKESNKQEKVAKINAELDIARKHYNNVFGMYRNHLVQCIGEENSNGPTAKYANELWYAEHCRLWQIQSEAQTLVYNLERQLQETQ
jgi:hypothetical protein